MLHHLVQGIPLALLNSFVNALNDPLRKYLSKFMDPLLLVATRGIVQAPLFALWALLDCRGRVPVLNHVFWTSACLSGAINIVTSYLYNRSVQISSISTTVPFLSFTPAFLVLIGFLVLGEVPSMLGIAGIATTAMGGFWLQASSVDPVRKGVESMADVNRGSAYMILVAFLWSISSAFDKIGVQHSNPIIYGATIQVMVAVGSFILQRFGVGARELYAPLGTQVTIPWKAVVLAGLVSVASYYLNLVASQALAVSYVIAIKRSGCIWSVLLARLFFQERQLRKKIPSIVLMICGVICIILGKE